MQNPLLNKRVLKAPNEIIPFTDPRITWPKYGSIKFDGHRILAVLGVDFYTPSGKEHVNQHIALHWQDFWYYCAVQRLIVDAEIWSPVRPFHELQSIIRTRDRALPEDVGLYVFDVIPEAQWAERVPMHRYADRYAYYKLIPKFMRVYPVEQTALSNADEAERWYNHLIENGSEGLMLRSMFATYKHGRCTHNEDHLYKFKHFITQDGVIVGYEQMQRLVPDAEVRVNSFGLIERSHRNDDYAPSEELGAFYVTQDGGKTSFKVTPGKGYTMEDRQLWWKARESLIGKGLEFQFMPHGSKDVPRMGRLVRFRPDKDSPDIKTLSQTSPLVQSP